MNINKLFGTLLASTLVFSSIAFAQQSSDDETQPPQYERDYGEGEFKGKHKGKHKGKGKRIAKMMKRVDTNEDGQIDLNEFLAHSEQRFQNMDLNSDGYVTPEEARESHKAMREKFREERKNRKQAKESSGDS